MIFGNLGSRWLKNMKFIMGTLIGGIVVFGVLLSVPHDKEKSDTFAKKGFLFLGCLITSIPVGAVAHHVAHHLGNN